MHHQHISNCFHQYKRNSVRLHNLSRIAICGKLEEIPMKFLLIIGPLTVHSSTKIGMSHILRVCFCWLPARRSDVEKNVERIPASRKYQNSTLPPSIIMFYNSFCFSLTKPQSFADCVGDELPVGWEQVLDMNRGVYYVNHVESKL